MIQSDFRLFSTIVGSKYLSCCHFQLFILYLFLSQPVKCGCYGKQILDYAKGDFQEIIERKIFNFEHLRNDNILVRNEFPPLLPKHR